jgi:hypothetical protein
VTGGRRQRRQDAKERLREAELAADSIADRGKSVDRQISLVERLTEGWRKVHAENHLAQLFSEEWGRTHP